MVLLTFSDVYISYYLRISISIGGEHMEAENKHTLRALDQHVHIAEVNCVVVSGDAFEMF